MLLINTYYVMGAAVNTTLIAGVFRAGGDSRFGFICDTIDMWCYAVPLGFLAAFVFKLPVMWVYFLLCTDWSGQKPVPPDITIDRNKFRIKGTVAEILTF